MFDLSIITILIVLYFIIRLIFILPLERKELKTRIVSEEYLISYLDDKLD